MDENSALLSTFDIRVGKTKGVGMSQWWIDEPIVLGSSNPTNAQLEKHYQDGFRSIISLLDENEQHPYYDTKKAEAMGFNRHSIPVKDFAAPTLNEFRQFLKIMNRASGRVLIHCYGGYGRTGTMAAAYWIDKGLPAHKAITKVRISNPGAVEIPEQEESLYELEAVLTKEC